MSPLAAAREVIKKLESRAELEQDCGQHVLALSIIHTMRAFEQFVELLESNQCSDDAGCLCGCKG